MDTEQIDHSIGDVGEENADVNDNNNQCPCIRANQDIERDLKSIISTANRVLSKLDVNKQKCSCCRKGIIVRSSKLGGDGR